jgi:transcriptional regulator with XRE-family HTH domain
MPVVLKKHAEKHYKIARTIHRIRKEKGLTQEQLAEKLGISLTYMGRLEIGQRIPNLRMLYRIAEILGVPVRDLIPF